jgi:O-acetylserine/cysteine efflux transporter
MPERSPFSVAEWAALAAIVLIWGVNNAAAKLMTEVLSPILVGGLRFALSAVLLIPFVRPPFPERRLLVLLILCGGPLHFALVYWGFALAEDLSPFAVSLQLWIPFVALLSWLFLGERMPPAALAGMAVAFVGVAFMTLDGPALQDLDAILVGAVASLFWAAATVLARRMSAVPPLKMQGLISWVAAPALLAPALAVEPDGLARFVAAGPEIWAMLAFAGAVSSVGATALMFWLVQRREAGRVTPYLLATPLVSVAIGVGWLGDVMTVQIAVGGLATLAGVAIVALSERRQLARPVSEPA